MSVKFEELDENIPSLTPMHTDFETAYLSIKHPVQALVDSILQMGVDGGNNKGLLSVAATLRNFLEQLDFLIEHSVLNGDSILFADVQHPFDIQPLPKGKNESDKRMEVKNA